MSSVEDKESYVNYRNEFAMASRFERRFDYPIHVDIELTNTCNYNCSFCEHGKAIEVKKEYYKSINILPKEKVYSLLDECKKNGTKSIQFNVANEPLLYEDIVEVIRYAKKLNFPDIYFSSNGSLLNKEKSLELIKSGLTKIMFSIDAYTNDVYLKTRRKGNYQFVVNNILEFVKLKKEMKTKLPVTRVSFVLTEINKHQKEAFEKFWKDKVDSIAFQNLIKLKTIEDSNKKRIEALKTYRCNMPYFRLTIKADGSIKPCCVFYGEEHNFGNIYKDKIYDLWNKEKFKEFQQMHTDYCWYKNEICKRCVLSVDFLITNQ